MSPVSAGTPDFVAVTRLDQVPSGAGRRFEIRDKAIALFNIDGMIHAIEDACPHQGISLGGGIVEGKVVTCRAHGWSFDVTTGRMVDMPGYGVERFPVKIVDDMIMVGIESVSG